MTSCMKFPEGVFELTRVLIWGHRCVPLAAAVWGILSAPVTTYGVIITLYASLLLLSVSHHVALLSPTVLSIYTLHISFGLAPSPGSSLLFLLIISLSARVLLSSHATVFVTCYIKVLVLFFVTTLIKTICVCTWIQSQPLIKPLYQPVYNLCWAAGENVRDNPSHLLQEGALPRCETI